MVPSIALKIGNDRMHLTLPEQARTLTIREPQPIVTEASFAADLDEGLHSKPFHGRRIAVVVADKTRLCDYPRYLPVLLDRLAANGASQTRITLYIAYGTHPVQSDRESHLAYGDTFSRFRFVHHHCDDDALFSDLGTTLRGTPVRIRKDILDADWVVTFGAVAHHYFAGFGGGRKLIFPGLGQREAINHNHRLFLDPEQRTLSAGCRPGNLDSNPLALDLAEIERYRPADLAIHGILNSSGVVCRLMVGSGVDHFRQACQRHAHNCEVSAGDGYDMVVASCGGHPKDINFIQAHKAVHHAAAFVRDRSTLIVYARCPEGIGSTTFLPWFDMGGWDAVFDHLSDAYQGNGGTALAMMEKCRRVNIVLVTDLSSDDCRRIGVTKLDPARAARLIDQYRGSLAVIPNASLLVKG